jgi:hypothetical protein
MCKPPILAEERAGSSHSIFFDQERPVTGHKELREKRRVAVFIIELILWIKLYSYLSLPLSMHVSISRGTIIALY